MAAPASVADAAGRPVDGLTLAASLAPSPAAPQQQQEPTFRATVPLVVAPVSVTDAAGRPVDGLTGADFELLDNGRPRRFDTDERIQPIALVVAVQASSTAVPALNRVRRIGSMIEPLIIGARGQAAVIAFDGEVRTAEGFTNDAGRLTRALASIQPGGAGHALVDAVDAALAQLREHARDHRRVILLISELRDSGSKAGLTAVATRAQRDNTSIYTLTYSPFLGALTARAGEAPPPGGLNLLALFGMLKQQGEARTADVLSEYTGGRRLGFLKQDALERAVTAIGEELHSQYLLSFEPPRDTSGEYHRIEVRVKKRSGVTVRTRPGYWLEAGSAR